MEERNLPPLNEEAQPELEKQARTEPEKQAEEVRLRFNPILAYRITSQAESFFTVLMKKRMDINEMANVIGHMGKMLVVYAEQLDGAVKAAKEGSSGPN